MTIVTLSPKFQIVIPKEVREDMELSAGMKMTVINYDNMIELIPIKPMKNAYGSLKGMDTTIIREKDRIL